MMMIIIANNLKAASALTEIDAESIANNPIVYGLVFGMAGKCSNPKP
jgi:hypothetical protein